MKDRGGDLEREHFFRKIERRRREGTKVFGGKKVFLIDRQPFVLFSSSNQRSQFPNTLLTLNIGFTHEKAACMIGAKKSPETI